jgi:amino acid permease
MAKSTQRKVDEQPMFFSAFNYRLIGIAILLIVSGFTAMYMENEVNGFISLYISPIVILAGYIVVIFAILKHDRDKPKESDQEVAS